MKKYILAIFLFLMPLNTLAYSDYIYRGGKTIGIEVKSNGIMVVGFYEVDGRYNKGELENGDYIIKAEGKEVSTVKELTNIIEENSTKDFINLTIRRSSEEKEVKLNLLYSDGIYKTGLYVKDSITGIGTLTYVDPETKIYGALGHEIIDSQTSTIVDIRTGDIFKNYINGIEKSSIGVAGSKNAKYYYDTKYGSIDKNTIHGIFGKYTASTNDLELVKVSSIKDIKIGKATIYTVLNKEEIEEYEINITKINENSKVKNITFEITDKKLIEKTGGVIQGMSGSPILQNNQIIGVVTHVIVDNPVTGYGLFITTMLEEGEK